MAGGGRCTLSAPLGVDLTVFDSSQRSTSGFAEEDLLIKRA